MNEREIEIEHWDIRFWTSPKRIIPMEIRFSIPCRYCGMSPCQCDDWFGNL
jgi:hypothetical protein